jgi:hypothetical protein
VLRIDSGDELALGGNAGDPFASQMAVPGQPIRLDRRGLARLKASQVVVRRWPNPHIPCQYFRIMDPELPLEVAPCGHFFEADELEMVGRQGGCLVRAREPPGGTAVGSPRRRGLGSRAACAGRRRRADAASTQAVLEHGHAPFSRAKYSAEGALGEQAAAQQQRLGAA